MIDRLLERTATEVDVLQQPTSFGPELRRLRLEAGLTLGQLSLRVHYSKAQLSKVERGLKPPSRELVALCDAELRADGALTALTRREAPDGRDTQPGTPAPLPGTDEEGEVWLMRLDENGASWFRPVSRRQTVAAGAATVMGLGLGTAPAAVAESTGTALLRSARTLFDEYRRLGQASAPEIVLPALIAQTHTLRELALRTRVARTRQQLLALASRYAEYIGWLVQETGDDRGALWWTDRAVHLADAGGDPHLAAYAQVRRALVTLYRGDATATVGLARRAQGTGLPPRIRGLAAQREAQGHALAGDHGACMRSLERARRLLTDAHEDDSPVIGTTTLADPVAMVTGWCLYDLGRPQEAAEIIDRELARVPPHAVRSQARFGARHALARATAGDIDHACALTDRLLDHAHAVNSTTIGTDLRRLVATLTRHHDSAPVRALAPRLAAVSLPGPVTR